MSRRPFYRCMAWLFTNVPPLFSALEFQARGLLLYTFAAYIPMCYRASLSCGASSRPNQEGGMQVRYRASLATISASVVAASRSSQRIPALLSDSPAFPIENGYRD